MERHKNIFIDECCVDCLLQLMFCTRKATMVHIQCLSNKQNKRDTMFLQHMNREAVNTVKLSATINIQIQLTEHILASRLSGQCNLVTIDSCFYLEEESEQAN